MAFLQWLVQFESVLFIIMFITLSVFFIAILIWTPAMTFFKARVFGRGIGAFFRRDRKIHFRTINLKGVSGIQDKKYGLYNISEDSVFTKSVSGASLITFHTDIGMGLPPRLAEATQRLHDMGIKNREQAEAVEERWHYCPECNVEQTSDFVRDDEGVITAFFCKKHPKALLEKRTLTVDLSPDEEGRRQSMTWRQIKEYMEGQINPVFQQTMVERTVDDERQDLKSLHGGTAKFVGLGMTVLIIVVAVIIFLVFMSNQQAGDVVGQCRALMNAAGCGV